MRRRCGWGECGQLSRARARRPRPTVPTFFDQDAPIDAREAELWTDRLYETDTDSLIQEARS